MADHCLVCAVPMDSDGGHIMSRDMALSVVVNAHEWFRVNVWPTLLLSGVPTTEFRKPRTWMFAWP